MRFFFDTEFIEDGHTIDLISIGIVDDIGREFYCCNSECNLEKANPWVQENVMPFLPPFTCDLWANREEMKRKLIDFIEDSPLNEAPHEFWAFYADYDWVVLCQLFGSMMDLPKSWPMYCRDLKQLIDISAPQIMLSENLQEHNALCDARWVRDSWIKIMSTIYEKGTDVEWFDDAYIEYCKHIKNHKALKEREKEF